MRTSEDGGAGMNDNDIIKVVRTIEVTGPRWWVNDVLENSWLQPGKDMSKSIHPPRLLLELARTEPEMLIPYDEGKQAA